MSDSEIEILFSLIEELKAEGKVIIYVSHRMAEIFKISDEIFVMKDGCGAASMITKETTEAELIKAMVGRDIGDTYANLSRNTEYGDVLLEVKNLSNKKIHDVSFSVRKGEVIGFAGLVGAGRTELVRAIFAADKITSGEIIYEGKTVNFKSPADAVEAGIALCPEDRKDRGLVLYRSIRENVTMPVLSKIKKGIFLDKAYEKKLTEDAIEKYSIKTNTMEKIVVETLPEEISRKSSSGRWTNGAMDAKLLILDEPTKGIDVGTKAEIYQMVCDFAKQGYAVIFISSELTEVINVADTIYVMREGSITGQVEREDATEEGILALAMLH